MINLGFEDENKEVKIGTLMKESERHKQIKLSHIDTLIDNIVQHSFFSFMDDFFGYNQTKIDAILSPKGNG